MKTPSPVKDYYERNTRLFLWLGNSRASGVIHRALWLPGVTNRSQALQAVHGLVAAAAAPSHTGLQVLDLGCGAGGSLCALALRPELQPLRGLGVTLSAVQANLARRRALHLGLADRVNFIQADFNHLPEPAQSFDLAYAIEAFVHGENPAAFFQSAAGALAPGGRLVVVDDFLTPLGAASLHHPLLIEFQRGWHTPGLTAPVQAIQLAAAAGLTLLETRDLSPHLQLNTWRDRLTALSAAVIRRLGLHNPYFDSLTGGDALRRAHAHGLIRYQMITFARSTQPSE